MLKSLTLRNFRGFAEHQVDFGKEAILIGQNNAGKTTVVEALRVLSVCQVRALSASFIPTPNWIGESCQGAGFRLSLDTIDFDFANVHHAYDTSAPAIIIARLRNNNSIYVFIGREPTEVFCQLKKGQNIVYQRGNTISGVFGSTRVMPPIGSLLPREKRISKDRLIRFLDGYLAYRHFRNQLWEKPAEYRIFKETLENTWQNLQIQHFENDHGPERNEFSLLIREGRFTSEISWHGHGLQAWAQTIWFLSRVPTSSTIVLDEPDVYLHADLQRKLIKVIGGFAFRQSIIATHSPEIISDVPFANVVVVQKREKRSRPAVRGSEIQDCLRSMGSIHSIQLSKVANSGLILFVEGDDRLYLSDVAFKMGTRVFDAFSEVAVQEIKGKGNWSHALGASLAIGAASGGDVSAFLILDSDYMLDSQRDHYLQKAGEARLGLHIWRRKEIENYFLIPAAIARYVSARTPHESEVFESDVEAVIKNIELDMKQDLILSYSSAIQNANKALDSKSSFKKAEQLVRDKMVLGFRVADLVSGKECFSALSKRYQDTHQVSFSALSICKAAFPSEIDSELQDLVRQICSGRKPRT